MSFGRKAQSRFASNNGLKTTSTGRVIKANASTVAPATVMATLRAAGFTQVQRYTELGIFSEYTAVKSA